MHRLIDEVVPILRHFIGMTHCNGEDRGYIGKFDDHLTWLEQSQQRTGPLLSCLEGIEVGGGTRLYDSLCDAVDHMCARGDRSRPWFVFVVACSNDSTSRRSAEGCKQHVTASAGRKDLSIIIVSIGSSVSTEELDRIAADTCIRHIHAKSARKLENALVWGVSINSTGGLQSAMDYAIIVDTSACMGMPAPAASPAPPRPASLPPRYPRAAAPSLATATSSQSSSSQLQMAVSRAPPAVEGHIPAGLLAAARAYESSLHEEQLQTRGAGLQAPGVTEPKGLDVRVREFSNRLLHPGDRQIFREFAQKNYYRNLLTNWDEEDIEYLVLVEQSKRSIVGLLVMALYDTGEVHIRLMVVDEEHRGRGLGTQMLTHVAVKHAGRKVTLNVDFDKPELLKFYAIKGYATLEDLSTEHRVLMLTLNHAGLIAKIPLPDLPSV